MDQMVEVVIDSVRASLMSTQRLVVLRQTDADRFLPIYVGPYEAESITVALNEVEVKRPLTHDLLKNIITAFNANITRIEIIALHDDTYFGNIVIESNGIKLNIDSRPSDAIALAVRMHVPILVHESVMISGSSAPEKDLTTQAPPPPTTSRQNAPMPPIEMNDQRLSVFEDFLTKLNDDRKDDSDSPSDPPDKPTKPKKKK